MKISVIISVFNEEAHMEACLSAVQSPDLPTDFFEIIVVDNGSTDRTASLARNFQMKHELRVLSQTRTNVSLARNNGAAAARGEVLCFLDGDCMARPKWLAEAYALAEENAVWGGHYLIPLDATWVGRTWFRYQATQREGPVSFIPAGSLFIHHSDFNRVKGFDPELETAEDVDFCNRARAAGMQVLAFRSLSVFHEGTPRTLGHFYRQNRWHGKHVLTVFLSQWPSTKDLPLIVLTFFTLLIFWVAVIGLVAGAVWHHWIPLWIALALLLLPPALLSLMKTVPSLRVMDIPALFVLYLTYLLSRSASFARVLLEGLRSRIVGAVARP